MARQAEEVDACLAGFVRWMGEVASNLPPQLRHGACALEQAFRDSRENLRALMEEAARHDLAARLTEQKVRESRVSRTQDEEGDEALRRPLREQEEKLRALTARQEELESARGANSAWDPRRPCARTPAGAWSAPGPPPGTWRRP